ncbi:MAG TPA: hypothetical protein VL461_07920 [Dictyobacter sp.]|jgi:hypothetical protein|nr:hypothetical protein [Dictyobacter sp.]
MTYPLGWPLLPQFRVKRERWPGKYRTKGIPLVYPGQEVVPDQLVLRLEQDEQAMPTREGKVANPDHQPSASPASQPQILQENVPAGLRGRVVGFTPRGGVVIESKVAVLQGVVGSGIQVAGVVTPWSGNSETDTMPSIPPGAILVVPGPLSLLLLRQAINSGVVGIVASSISLPDLEGFLRTDYLQMVYADDMELVQSGFAPITLLCTEGIGVLPMSPRTWQMLQHYAGSIALLSGATSLRYSIFPELLISLSLAETPQNWQPVQPDTSLALGVLVRICSGRYAGVIGFIDYFFVYEQSFSSGVRAQAVRVRMEDGTFCVVPLLSVERIA